MRFVTPLMKHVVYPGLSKCGYLRRAAASVPVVVTYHGVLPAGYDSSGDALDGNLISPQQFISQLRFLKSNYNVISPEQFRRWGRGELNLPARSVLLTCDDGLLNNLTDMLPVILQQQVKFLFFVTGDSAAAESTMLWHEQVYLWLTKFGCATASASSKLRRNDTSGWQEIVAQLSRHDAKTRADRLADLRTQLGISQTWQSPYSGNEALRRRFFLLNARELRELRDAGMTVGAHTLSHPMLSQMSGEDALHEIARSRNVLEETFGESVWALAYPFGTSAAVTPREQEFASEAGFEFAFMNEEESAGQFSFPRIHVSANTTVSELDAHLSGFYSRVRQRFGRAACA